jgi:hypothetical protein
MSMHIQRFVDRLRGFESRGAKDFTMNMSDAKDLHADITRLLIALQTLQQTPAQDESTVQIEITGGQF